MKRTILLSVMVLLVLATSCTTKISSLDTKRWDDLTTVEQTLFNASVYDSTIIKDAIIIEDKIIIFDPMDNTFTKVLSYDISIIIALTCFLVVVMVLIIVFFATRD